MSRLFTVKWPFLARLDAILFFPVALILASEITLVRTFVEHTLTPPLPAFLFRLGVSRDASFWAGMAIAGFVPYVLLLVIADRLLTVRKGFALLSVLAISVWAAAALGYAPRLAALVPKRFASELDFLAAGRHVAFTACGLVLLLHLRPLWIGLRDQGEVAIGLINGTDGFGFGRDKDGRSRHDRDVYYRQTADFRGWKQQDQLDDFIGAPKESPGLKFIFGIAWVGVMLGLGFAWFHWTSWGAGGHEARMPVLAPEAQTGRASGKPNMHPSALAAVSGLPPIQVARDKPVPIATLPMVQRPSEVPEGQQSENGPNEAVAERGKDGSFAFDAVINGAHVSMLFDTGASVVALRAEDARRFGISLSDLNYSAKVKTANGTADVAPIIIDTLRIGNITQRRVVGYVAREGVLPRNLLGQTFLSGLSGYNVENNRLVLKGH